MKNEQAIEKQDLTSNTHLQLNSIFQTIQGEGPFTGHPAIFIRLAGCNLQCPQCDTEYTKRNLLHYDDIADSAIELATDEHKIKLIVITGGEPLRQDIGRLVNKLLSKGFNVQIETNGTLFIPSIMYTHHRLTIVCSPKTGKVNENLEPYIKAFKYVLSADDYDVYDGLPNHALEHVCKKLHRPKNKKVPVYLQPVDSKNANKYKTDLQACIQNCQKFGYILGIQMHKVIDVL